MTLFPRSTPNRIGPSACFVKLLPILAILAVTSSGCRDQSRDATGIHTGGKPNLMLVLIDTLRQDRTSAYGYSVNTTPFLRQVASEGALINGYSPTSWTRPATASLLSGLHPIRHQTFTSTDVLPLEVDTLAEILKRNGYTTIGVSANLHITKQWGFNQGFDVFLDMGELTKNPKSSAYEVNLFLENFLDRIEAPFFLYVHYIDPHAPYAPPTDGNGNPLSPMLKKYSPVEPEQLEGGAYVRHRRSLEFVQAASDLYDGEVRFVDEHIEALIDSLEARSLMRNTISIITSDHGEEFEDHGRMSHGQTLYEEVVRVPLIVHGPGIVRGARLEGKANLLDIVPTVVDLLDLPEAEAVSALDGVTIADSLTSGAPIPEKSISLHLDHIDGHTLGWISENWKILVGTSPFAKDLFDLERDPTEQASLSTGRNLPLIFADLNEDLVHQYNDFQSRQMPRRVASMDPEQQQQLAALGYVIEGDTEDARRFPARITTADDRPQGTTGLEGEMTHCADLGSTLCQAQLYNGFFYIENLSKEDRGRWTSGTASLSLHQTETPGRTQVVAVEGLNTRSSPYTLTAYAHGAAIIGPVTISKPGRFRLRSSALPDQAGSLLVSVDITPPWEPAMDNLADDRSLGTFLTRICIEELDPAEIGSEVDIAGNDDHHVELHTAFGVFDKEPSLPGRWTLPHSGFYIANEDSGTTSINMLTLDGFNFRQDTHPLVVRVDGREVFSGTVSLPGRAFNFDIPLPMDMAETDLHFIELESTPWSPGKTDQRILGVFLSRIALHKIDPTTMGTAVDLTKTSEKTTFVTGLLPEIELAPSKGSWVEPHSSYQLAIPEPIPEHIYAVEMKGSNLRCDKHTITILINGVKVLSRRMDPLICEETIDFEGLIPSYLADQNVALVEIVVAPPLSIIGESGEETGLGTIVESLRLFQKPSNTVLDRLYFFKPEAVPQMAHGFFDQEDGMDGRWTEPTGAGYLLRVPDISKPFYDLVLNTVTYRNDKFTVTVFVDESMVFQGRSGNSGAPLQAEVPIPNRLEPGDLVYVEVFIDPPFIPLDHGLADNRILGTFVRRTWLQ